MSTDEILGQSFSLLEKIYKKLEPLSNYIENDIVHDEVEEILQEIHDFFNKPKVFKGKLPIHHIDLD